MDGDRASTGVGVDLISNRGGGPGITQTVIMFCILYSHTNMYTIDSTVYVEGINKKIKVQCK